jgi:c-di-GMP-binding flagellar brake protein YcgR
MMEKRNHPRLDVSHLVLYSSDIYPRPNVASTLNLSLGGARMEVLYSLMAGERLQISIAIHPQVIKCRAKVIHLSTTPNKKMEAGIQFEELSAHDSLYLRQYLFHVMEQRALGSDLSLDKTPP